MTRYNVQVTHPVLGTTRTVFQATHKKAKAYIKEARKRTSLINFAIVKDATELSKESHAKCLKLYFSSSA